MNLSLDQKHVFCHICNEMKYISIDTYILFDNESNKSTGGQNTYQSHVDYKAIAKGSGFEVIGNKIIDLNDFKDIIEQSQNSKGLKFLHLKCGIDNETPRPPLDIIKVNKI